MSDSNIISIFYDNLEPLLQSSQQFEQWSNAPRVIHDFDKTCQVCGAVNGQYHIVGCDDEICPKCNDHLSKCRCNFLRKTFNGHRMVPVEFEDNQGDLIKADIDIEIAPLILELWKAELWTSESCQSDPNNNWIWLYFDNVIFGNEFVNIVAKYEEGFWSMYSRIINRFADRDNYWQYSVEPYDLSLVEGTVDGKYTISHSRKVDFELCVSIRFPKIDYPAVFKRLLDHNNFHESGNFPDKNYNSSLT